LEADGTGIVAFDSNPDFRGDTFPLQSLFGTAEFKWAGIATRYVAQVSDGWIVALNGGEFGAGIWWVSKDGSKRRDLGGGHVVELIKTSAGVLAPIGLDHISAGHGAVLLIDQAKNGRWRSKRLAAIGSSAYAATAVTNRSILVVTRTQLVRVNLDGKVTVLHRGRWDGQFELRKGVVSSFSPGSIVQGADGRIWIGMNAAIVHLVPDAKGYREEWLVPRTCLLGEQP
jgi:hypothetical protein